MRPKHSIRARTVLYFAAVFAQAIGSISLPAASNILKSARHVGLSDTQYGLLYLPMIVTMIAVTSVFYPLLVRLGRRGVFLAGLSFNLLFFSVLLVVCFFRFTGTAAFFWLLAANGLLGAGFGLLVSDLNLLMEDMYPSKRDAALSGLHGCLGLGASVTPLAVDFFHRSAHWGVIAAIDLCVLTVMTIMVLLDRDWIVEEFPVGVPSRTNRIDWSKVPPAVVGFLMSLVFYGIVESLMGNWSPVYLMSEKGFSLTTGTRCLALFWFSLTVGRLMTSYLTLKLDPRFFYRILPLLLVAGLVFLVRTDSERWIALPYVLIGLGCSAFYPLTVSLAVGYHSRWREVISSLSLGMLVIGVGIGSCVTGYLRDQGIMLLGRVFMLSSACAMIMGVFAFFLTKRKMPV